MQCVVLAGGLGTRLHPLTQSTPKYLSKTSLLPITNSAWLAKHGVTHVVLIIGRLGEQIIDYVQRWKKMGNYCKFCG